MINEVLRAVGPLFPVRIRINSTDKLKGELTTVDALKVVRLINQTLIDLIDSSAETLTVYNPALNCRH